MTKMGNTKEENIKSAEAAAVNFEDAISLTGYGKYHIAVLLTCGGLLMAVIIETVSMSYILPAAQCDFNLSLSEKGMLSGVSFLGVVLSSHMWGFIGDTLGRRKLIVVTTYISALAGFLSSLSPIVWLFILLRFLNGFFIGGASAVIYAYLGEFHNNQYRPRVIQWAAVFVALATVMLPSLAWLILPMEWSFPISLLNIDMRPWRLLIMIFSIPSIIFATCLWKLDESPKFIWVHGDSQKTMEILRKMYVWNTGNPESLYSVIRLAEPGPSERPKFLNEADENLTKTFKRPNKVIRCLTLMWQQTAPLFKPPHLANTIMCSTLQFGVFASSSGFLMWLPDVLNKVSNYMVIHPNSSVMICKALDEYNLHMSNNLMTENFPDCSDTVDEDVFKILLIFGCFFAASYMFLGIVINRTGKKILLVIYLVVTGLAGISIEFIEGYTSIVMMICLFLSCGSCVSIINAIVVDLYPTQYRAMAIALSLMMGRFGAVAGSHIIGYLLEANCSASFYIFGGEHLALLLITIMIPIPLLIYRKKAES